MKRKNRIAAAMENHRGDFCSQPRAREDTKAKRSNRRSINARDSCERGGSFDLATIPTRSR
jgi:hypothetical protein